MAKTKKPKRSTKVEAPRDEAPWKVPAAFGLLAVVLAAIAHFVASTTTGGPSVDLARDVPSNVTAFVEVPSVARLNASSKKMRVAAPSGAATEATADALAAALAASFHVPRPVADTFEQSVVALGVAGRVRGKEVSSAWLAALAPSGTAAVEPFLRSSRLMAEGPVGRSGASFRVTPGAPGKDVGPFEKSLRGLSTGDTGLKIAWFAAPRLLVAGDDALVHDIASTIDDGKGDLAGSPAWTDAVTRSRLRGEPDGVFFGDVSALRSSEPFAEATPLLDAYAHDGAVVAGSFALDPTGLALRATVPLSGEGAAHEGALSPPAKLTFPSRLPKDTALFVAASTRHEGRPADVRRAVDRASAAAGGVLGVDLAGQVEAFEKASGAKADDLFEMAGDEAALAVVVDRKFKYSLMDPILTEGLTHAGVVLAMKVAGDAAAQRVLAKLRAFVEASELGRVADIRAEGAGFVARPNNGATARMMGLIGGTVPTLRVTYAKKEVVVAVGQPPILEAIFSALEEGKDTLSDDAAYERTMSALPPGARAYAWLDLARVASVVYTANASARLDAKNRGWPVDSLVMSGPDRVTEAFSLDVEDEAKGLTVQVDAVNPWGVELLTGWLMSLPGARPMGSPPRQPGPGLGATPPPTASTPETTAGGAADPFEEMPHCKDLLTRLAHCAKSSDSAEARERYARQEAEGREKYTSLPEARRSIANTACVGPLFQLRRDPDCQK